MDKQFTQQKVQLFIDLMRWRSIQLDGAWDRIRTAMRSKNIGKPSSLKNAEDDFVACKAALTKAFEEGTDEEVLELFESRTYVSRLYLDFESIPEMDKALIHLKKCMANYRKAATNAHEANYYCPTQTIHSLVAFHPDQAEIANIKKRLHRLIDLYRQLEASETTRIQMVDSLADHIEQIISLCLLITRIPFPRSEVKIPRDILDDAFDTLYPRFHKHVSFANVRKKVFYTFATAK